MKSERQLNGTLEQALIGFVEASKEQSIESNGIISELTKTVAKLVTGQSAIEVQMVGLIDGQKMLIESSIKTEERREHDHKRFESIESNAGKQWRKIDNIKDTQIKQGFILEGNTNNWLSVRTLITGVIGSAMLGLYHMMTIL